MLFNDVIMMSSQIENKLVHSYVDHWPIKILTKF